MSDAPTVLARWTFRIPQYCATCERPVHFPGEEIPFGAQRNEAAVSSYGNIAQLYAKSCGHVLGEHPLVAVPRSALPKEKTP